MPFCATQALTSTCLSRYLFNSNKIAVCATLSVIIDFFSDILDVTAEVDLESIMTIDQEEAKA